MARRSISASLRFSVYERDRHTCQYCGKKPPEVELQIDHVFPVLLGGDNKIDNLLTACQRCNAGKGARDPGLALPARPQTPEEARSAAQQEARWWAEVCIQSDAQFDSVLWELAAKADGDGILLTLPMDAVGRAAKERTIRGLIAVGLLRSKSRGADEWWLAHEEFYQVPEFPMAGSGLRFVGPISGAPSILEVYG